MDNPVTIRLSCQLPSEAAHRLRGLIIRRESKKGKTLIFLIELARSSPDAAIDTFADTAKSEPCTLNVTEEWLKGFAGYRERHGLFQNTAFMRDAVLRGLSIQNNQPSASTSPETKAAPAARNGAASNGSADGPDTDDNAVVGEESASRDADNSKDKGKSS